MPGGLRETDKNSLNSAKKWKTIMAVASGLALLLLLLTNMKLQSCSQPLPALPTPSLDTSGSGGNTKPANQNVRIANLRRTQH